MTIEEVRSLLADENASVTEADLADAVRFFEKDAQGDCAYAEEFLSYYELANRSLGLTILGGLHSCTQKYAARIEDEADGENPALAYLYLKEMDFYTALHSYSEGFRFINLILDLESAPDYCVAAALIQAIDLFMACWLKEEAKQYVDRTRAFALLCDLPDTYKLILDCNLMQGYAFVGDRDKYRFFRKRIYTYDDEIYDGPLETALRIFCLGSKALLEQDSIPDETDIAELKDLFDGNLTSYGMFVDYASIIVPIFRWVKGSIPDADLIRYSMKMIDVSAAISDKLDLYAFLSDEIALDPKQAEDIRREYHETLRRYYENSVENHRYEVLGEIVSHEIGRQYRKDSLTDRLTETGNRYAYERALDRIMPAGEGEDEKEYTIFVMDVNGLKQVNDTYGHAAGDAYIKGAAQAILETLGQNGAFFRTGGDEFAAIWIDPVTQPDQVIAELREQLSRWSDPYGNTLSMAVGYASSADHKDCSVKEVVRLADEAMYADKRAFYAQNGRDRRARRS